MKNRVLVFNSFTPGHERRWPAPPAPVVRAWSEQGIDHAGVVFVDERTIAPDDFGGLVRALSGLWDATHAGDWKNRCVFLARKERR